MPTFLAAAGNALPTCVGAEQILLTSITPIVGLGQAPRKAAYHNAPAALSYRMTDCLLIPFLTTGIKSLLRLTAVSIDPTVLATEKLPAAQRALFAGAALPGQLAQSAPALPEPHASWVDPLEKEWLRRYG